MSKSKNGLVGGVTATLVLATEIALGAIHDRPLRFKAAFPVDGRVNFVITGHTGQRCTTCPVGQ